MIPYSANNQGTSSAGAGGGVGDTVFNIGGNPNIAALATSPQLKWIALGVVGVALALWLVKRK